MNHVIRLMVIIYLKISWQKSTLRLMVIIYLKISWQKNLKEVNFAGSNFHKFCKFCAIFQKLVPAKLGALRITFVWKWFKNLLHNKFSKKHPDFEVWKPTKDMKFRLEFFLHALLHINLKIVFAIFYFLTNDNPSKTMKNAFYFIKKPFFILEICVTFPLFFQTFQIQKYKLKWKTLHHELACIN